MKTLTIKLRRDEPIFDENSIVRDFPWRCDIWEMDGISPWCLFATAWGTSRIEAVSKANSIIRSCAGDLDAQYNAHISCSE
jgi:hypothetical protein